METQSEDAIEKVIEKMREEQALLPVVREALTQFVNELSQMEQVHSAFVFASGRIVQLWTFLTSDDFDGAGDINEAEGRLMDNFDELLFDFFVIPKGNSPLEELAPTGAFEIYRKS